MQLRVYDTVSKHERTVTKKAFDIINRARRKQPRYQVLEYLDDEGNPTDAPQTVQIVEKKKEDVVAPAVDEQTVAGDPEITYHFDHTTKPQVITENTAPKKRGRKPKNKIENA
jgi:hypothetical protein